MALTVADRVKETTTTTGTGDFTLAGAVNGYAAFSSRLAVGDITFYAAVLGTQWEVGLGTLTATTTLQRTTVFASSNNDTPVNFVAGSKEVFIDFPAYLVDRLGDFAIPEAQIAAAATVDLGAANSRKVAITPTAATSITSFGTRAHREKLIRFTGSTLLVHNATSLILPGAASISTAAGDTALATSDAAGNWRVRHYQRADGAPLSASVGLDSFRTLAIRVAKLEGKAVGLFDYLVDDFQDFSGYDTTASLNATLLSGTVVNQAADPYTVLLMHFDGADGSTGFTDDTGKTVTANGGVALSTAQKKFGTASVLGGSGKYLTLGTQADLNFGTGNWSVETWVYVTSYNTYGVVISSGNTSFSSGARQLAIYNNGSLSLNDYDINSGGAIIAGGAAGDVPLNTWTHVAWVRNGTSILAFVNGVQKGSATISASQAFNFNSNSATRLLGCPWDGTSSILLGHMDDLRVSKGIARNSGSTYPVPTSALVAGTSGNLDLRSVAIAAQAQPTKASFLALIKATAGTINLNSTLTASITRTGNVADGTQFTLAKTGTLAGYDVYEGNGLDISSQPAGTSMKYRIQTSDTALGVAVDAVVAQWG